MMINPSSPPIMPADSKRPGEDVEINEVMTEGSHEGDESNEGDYLMEPPGIKIPYAELYQAVLNGDLETAKRLINTNTDPNNIFAETSILYRYHIALEIAVSTSQHISIVNKLLNLKPNGYLLTSKALPTGDTVLHKAAIAGNTKAAEILLREDPKLALKINEKNETPLHVAALYGHQETVDCLLHGVTYKYLTPFLGKIGARLLNIFIVGDFYDSALYVLKHNPNIALEEDDKDGKSASDSSAEKTHAVEDRKTASDSSAEKTHTVEDRKTALDLLDKIIQALEDRKTAFDLSAEKTRAFEDGKNALALLAEKTHAFKSGNSFGFWETLLYQVLEGISALRWSSRGRSSITTTASAGRDVENQVDDSWVVVNVAEKLGIMKRIKNKIMVHNQAMDLLKILVKKASQNNPADAEKLLVPPLHVAAQNGIHEIVTEIIMANPTLINRCDLDSGYNLFHIAVIHRQEQVFNLLYQMSSIKQPALLQTDNYGNNLLHLTASSEPSNKIAGAALKIQRQLQWFQAVEEMLPPSFKEKRNKDKKTPRELFTEQHAELVKEGEKWMKKTADACTIVAALIVTVAFAAAFTSPGGNKQDEGTPVYLWKKSFLIFAIADALALFFSSTSLLMFLGILTSRYSEKDFLNSLPKKMALGLITLFLSMAAMLVGFCASMYLVLFHRASWIGVPIAAVACVPVMVFAFLQFPLLVELVRSTFGPSIFRIRSNKVII